jgi:hypothetical protein
MKPATEFMLTLRALPNVDGIKAVRAVLKILLRRYGLRCIKIEEREADSKAPFKV